MSNVFSTEEQLGRIATILSGYLKIPFSGDSVPGSLMENVIAKVRGGEVLNTYDFVDVIDKKRKVGWQVKSTKAATPVTWKRAKIPNSEQLIDESMKDDSGLQKLGDAIIKFCNDHAKESMDIYGLDEIGFARLIVNPGNTMTYFERLLCSADKPKIFEESEFLWAWSTPKKTIKKEQLPALHGLHIPSNRKWFAWHGLGENQLHFSGESAWWPTSGKNRVDFNFPDQRLSHEKLMDLLERI